MKQVDIYTHIVTIHMTHDKMYCLIVSSAKNKEGINIILLSITSVTDLTIQIITMLSKVNTFRQLYTESKKTKIKNQLL